MKLRLISINFRKTWFSRIINIEGCVIYTLWSSTPLDPTSNHSDQGESSFENPEQISEKIYTYHLAQLILKQWIKWQIVCGTNNNINNLPQTLILHYLCEVQLSTIMIIIIVISIIDIIPQNNMISIVMKQCIITYMCCKIFSKFGSFFCNYSNSKESNKNKRFCDLHFKKQVKHNNDVSSLSFGAVHADCSVF